MRKIQLVLTDDWELRGDGSGDMRSIQFDNLRRLLAIYEKYHVRASINAEVMQQLYHRKFGTAHSNLLKLADEWDSIVRGAYSKGHDVQLHIHSQWDGATYDGKTWTLPGNWSIIACSQESIRSMVHSCKSYMEDLLRPMDPRYSCVSFRAGAWCIAPNKYMLRILADEGIVFDTSIVGGIAFNNSKISLDYRNCEEAFLPFYPDMEDARKLAYGTSPIVCVPTFTFRYPRFYALIKGAYLKCVSFMRRSPNVNNYKIWQTDISGKQENRNIFINDLAYLAFSDMVYMIRVIRKKAGEVRCDKLPVILENHTKDMYSFHAIERFARYISSQRDLEVITLSDVARNLKSGAYDSIIRSKKK